MNTPADSSLKAEISLEDKMTNTTKTTETTGMAKPATETETVDVITSNPTFNKPITTSQELVIVAPGPKLNQLATKMRN